MCVCRKERPRRSRRAGGHSQKETRRELQLIPKTVHVSSGRPSRPPLPRGQQPHRSVLESCVPCCPVPCRHCAELTVSEAPLESARGCPPHGVVLSVFPAVLSCFQRRRGFPREGPAAPALGRLCSRTDARLQSAGRLPQGRGAFRVCRATSGRAPLTSGGVFRLVSPSSLQGLASPWFPHGLGRAPRRVFPALPARTVARRPLSHVPAAHVDCGQSQARGVSVPSMLGGGHLAWRKHAVPARGG